MTRKPDHAKPPAAAAAIATNFADLTPAQRKHAAALVDALTSQATIADILRLLELREDTAAEARDVEITVHWVGSGESQKAEE